MKTIKRCIAVIFCALLLVAANVEVANAQCAMCSLNAENSTKGGNTQGRGLNNGIFFLLGAPFIIVSAVGFLWYKKFRNKDENKVYL